MTAQSDIGKTDAVATGEAEDHSSTAGRRKLILIVAAAALATILVVGAIALAVATSSWVKSGQIAQNVTIAGLDVGGMTGEEATAALRDRWIPSLPETVGVTFPGGEWEANRHELGARFNIDVAAQKAVRIGREGGLIEQMRARLTQRGAGVEIEVPVAINESTLEDAVGGLSQTVDREPVNADIKVAGTNVEVIPGVVGRRLDIAGTMDALKTALADPTTGEVAAVVETTQPSVTAEDLSHIEIVLAEYSTKYRTHQTDRTHNLRLAAERLNEHVVHPGETFSFNSVVGQRIASDGWRQADIFVDGEVEPSLAGGICQIASTLYNAALLANLDIVQRSKHSRPVDYVPTGRDATVYWNVIDLKFKNSLKHPILILGSVGGGNVAFKILGSRADNATVEITRQGLTRISHETKETQDPELEEGKKEVEKEGRDGWRVTVHRKATRDGAVLRDQRLHTDVYAAQTKVVRVGTRPPPEPEPVVEEEPATVRPGDQRPAESEATPAEPPAASDGDSEPAEQ